MAFSITTPCVNCRACVDVCPNEAIVEARPHFYIDAKRCTECDGDHADPQCASIWSNLTLGGKMLVAFVIRTDVSVVSVEVPQSTLNWPALDDAVRRRMQHWKFPRSPGGPVRVVFPFVFHPEM